MKLKREKVRDSPIWKRHPTALDSLARKVAYRLLSHFFTWFSIGFVVLLLTVASDKQVRGSAIILIVGAGILTALIGLVCDAQARHYDKAVCKIDDKVAKLAAILNSGDLESFIHLSPPDIAYLGRLRLIKLEERVVIYRERLREAERSALRSDWKDAVSAHYQERVRRSQVTLTLLRNLMEAFRLETPIEKPLWAA